MQNSFAAAPPRRVPGRRPGPGFGPGGPGAGSAPRISFATLGRAIRYLGHYPSLAIIAYTSILVSTAAQLMVPQLVQRVIDAVSNGYTAQQIGRVPATFRDAALKALHWTPDQLTRFQTGAESLLISAAVLIVALAIARGLFSFTQNFYSEKLSQSIAFDFRNDLYAKIQRLSFGYHDRNQTGQLMIRATDDVERVRFFIGQGLLMSLQSVVLLVCALVILFVTNASLMLVILPVLPIAMIMFMIFGSLMQPMFMKVQVKLSHLNTVLQENLAGIKVIKAFVREPQEQKRFDTAAEDLMGQQLKVARVMTFMFPVVFLIANLGQAAVMYFGGKQIIGGTLTFGEWQKFTMYLMYVFFPLGQLGMIISQLSQAGASSKRIFEILDAQVEVADKPGALPLPPVAGRVTFDHVTFRYFGEGEPVLHDVNFSAEPGQTVALLGATGSGKSTIINLIPRFYDASEGSILIDGYGVCDVQLESLRSQVGIVMQDTTLFSGTIRDNIAFARPNATLEEVIAVAKIAAAHDFIMEFPKGYDTPVGERGATLSGGQKQRVAIARALLTDPRILILDDSTSSVDVLTEYQIQQALVHLMRGRTSLVIAQRISTVRNADQILVLDKGKVAAQGRHDELIETSPIYAEIFHSQLVEDVQVSQPAETTREVNHV